MQPRLRRDSQQWMFDWVIEQTGKTYHFGGDSRGELPREVRSHAMISKHVAKRAGVLHQIARDEETAGHPQTALDLWFKASVAYARAQHPVFKNSPEKQLLHDRSLSCYARVRHLSPYRIEPVEVPFGESVVSGNLHLSGPTGTPAPCVFFIPGCDMTKEMFPHPQQNPAGLRGMHLFSFDGPGQGEANLRGVKLTENNYEAAVLAAVDLLRDHPAIDAERMLLFGLSFGSYWAMRTAAVAGDRFAGVAAPWSSVCDKRYLMEIDSPRYKQLFAYLTGASDEDQLDRFIEASTLDHVPDALTSPTLLAVGEYDPRSPLDEVLEFFDRMDADRELWVFEDQHHPAKVVPFDRAPIWGLDIYGASLDWLADRLRGHKIAGGSVVRRIGGGRGPSSEGNVGDRHWFDQF